MADPNANSSTLRQKLEEFLASDASGIYRRFWDNLLMDWAAAQARGSRHVQDDKRLVAEMLAQMIDPRAASVVSRVERASAETETRTGMASVNEQAMGKQGNVASPLAINAGRRNLDERNAPTPPRATPVTIGMIGTMGTLGNQPTSSPRPGATAQGREGKSANPPVASPSNAAHGASGGVRVSAVAGASPDHRG